MAQIREEIATIVKEWITSDKLHQGDLFVIGCSTSEVAGKRIGTAGSEDDASILFDELRKLEEEKDVRLAVQCCEHLNRALVVERETSASEGLEEVSVVPVPAAGGSMAAYAFKQMKDPVVVESIQKKAKAGIDIGETMIGMHMQHVAVPFRLSQRFVGDARVTAAYSRPKLIGGKRANYDDTRVN